MITRPPYLASPWADSGDVIQPADTYIASGFPHTDEKPTRQTMNWALNYATNGVLYLASRGIPDWDSRTSYITADCTRASDGKFYTALRANLGASPVNSPNDWTLLLVLYADIHKFFLTPADADAKYLTQAQADARYLKIIDAAATYLSITNADSTYLKKADAAVAYVTPAQADAKYATIVTANNLQAQINALQATVAALGSTLMTVDDIAQGSTGYLSHWLVSAGNVTTATVAAYEWIVLDESITRVEFSLTANSLWGYCMGVGGPDSLTVSAIATRMDATDTTNNGATYELSPDGVTAVQKSAGSITGSFVQGTRNAIAQTSQGVIFEKQDPGTKNWTVLATLRLDQSTLLNKTYALGFAASAGNVLVLQNVVVYRQPSLVGKWG